jgi:tryptophanyl-tRNA synthetase
VVAHLDPIRGRAEDLLSDPGELDRLLAVGAERASAQAEKTLKAVYEAVGFMAPRA